MRKIAKKFLAVCLVLSLLSGFWVVSSFASEDLGTQFFIVDSMEKILAYNSLGEMAIANIESPNGEVYTAYFKASYPLASGKIEMRLFRIYREKRSLKEPLYVSNDLIDVFDKSVEVNYI